MTLTDLLAAADPIAVETGPTPERRTAVRRTVVDAAARRGRKQGMSRRFVLAAAVAAALAAVATAPVWMGSEATLHAAMQFEVRLAAADPDAGGREAIDPGTNRLIHLDEDIVLTNRDISETSVVTVPGGFGVEVRFTDAGAAKLRSATARNLGRLLAVIVDGKVVAAPTVRSSIAEIGVIGGAFTREEAERLADGIRRPM